VKPARTDQHGDAVPWIVDRDRGARAVQDLGLDPNQIPSQALATLGQAIADQTPPGPVDLEPNQNLLQLLDQVADGWSASLAQGQHDVDHCLGQDHDHGRLREEGVNVDQDHDRVQLQARTHAWHSRCPHAGAGTETASEPRPSFTREEPDKSDIGIASALDRGQGGHQARAHRGKSPVQNVPDVPDEDWRPI
jgi:hypothetical protein